MKQNHKNKVIDERIIEAYNSEATLHEAAVVLEMTTVSLWRRAKDLGLAWRDKKRKRPHNKINLKDILMGKHPEYQTFKLKKRLLDEGIKSNSCEECKITEWNKKPVEMQLDHVDGNSHNHRLENLRLLCPNCHSQTLTYCGKNK